MSEILNFLIEYLSKKGKKLYEDTPFLNSAVDSLELIELINLIQTNFEIRFSLADFSFDDFETLGSFVNAVKIKSTPDYPRHWDSFSIEIENYDRKIWFLMGLRSRLPKGTLIEFVQNQNHVKVGIDTKNKSWERQKIQDLIIKLLQ